MSQILERLKQRKLVQWSLAYLAGAWVSFEVVGQLAHTFGWSEGVERVVFVLLATGFLATLVLAWYHGERGHQKVGGMEALMLAGILVLAGVGVVLVGRGPDGHADAPVAADAPAPPEAATASIAVLPFENFGSEEDQHFSDGISEEILNVLAQIPGLRVAARTSSFVYRGADQDIPQVARELNVGHVLEGSVRRAGNRVRITGQLISGEDGFHLWSDTYDRELTPENVFAVQDEIAQVVARELQLRVSEATGRAGRFQTLDPEAHDLFLLARSAYYEGDGESLIRARDLYERAIARDSSYALAWSGLAEAYGFLADAYLPPDVAYPLGLEAARRTVDLAPELGDAWGMLGAIRISYSWEMDEAMADAARALELNPSSTLARLTQAIYGMWQGGDAAHRECRGLDEARRVDPLNPMWPAMQSLCFSWGEHHREAIEARQAVDALDPDFVYHDRYAGWAYAALGMHEEAVREFEASERVRRRPSHAYIVYLAEEGRMDEARAKLQRLEEVVAAGEYLPPEFLAVALNAVGEEERAMEKLGEGLSLRSAGAVIPGLSPRMSHLLDTEAYRAMAEEYGFPLPGGGR